MQKLREAFEAKEYEFLNFVMLSRNNRYGEEDLINAAKKLSQSKDFLRWAISVGTNTSGYMSLNGIITPFAVLENTSFFDKNIINTLVNNILFGYCGTEKPQYIMHMVNMISGGKTYLHCILSNFEIEFLDKQQKQIVNGIKMLLDDGESRAEIEDMFQHGMYDESDNIIVLFFENPNISLKYKLEIADELDSTVISQLHFLLIEKVNGLMLEAIKGKDFSLIEDKKSLEKLKEDDPNQSSIFTLITALEHKAMEC